MDPVLLLGGSHTTSRAGEQNRSRFVNKLQMFKKSVLCNSSSRYLRYVSRLELECDVLGGVLGVEVPEVVLRQRLPEPTPDQPRAPPERDPEETRYTLCRENRSKRSF